MSLPLICDTLSRSFINSIMALFVRDIFVSVEVTKMLSIVLSLTLVSDRKEASNKRQYSLNQLSYTKFLLEIFNPVWFSKKIGMHRSQKYLHTLVHTL